MPYFIKKPVKIEAVLWDGSNHAEIRALETLSKREVFYGTTDKTLVIHTLEGDHLAQLGDYIIKGVNGELYPCKPDIFKKTYFTEKEYASLNNEYGVIKS